MQMVIILNAQVVIEINVLLHMSIMWNNNFSTFCVVIVDVYEYYRQTFHVTTYKIVFNTFKELRYSSVFQNKCILGNLESVL